MFKCGVCGILSMPGVKPTRKPTEVRRVEYINNNTKERLGEGWEIAIEKDMCWSCEGLHNLDYALIASKIPVGPMSVQRHVTINNSGYKRGYSGERHPEEGHRDERRRREPRKSS